MFESFYGLSGKPFSLLPDPGFLFLSKRHKYAINILDYGMMTEAGFIVITGEVGAGKTTIIRRYIKNAGPDVVVGVITNPNPSFGRVLNWVTNAFGLPQSDKNDAALYNSFVEFLLTQYAKGKRVVLIIDEAQNLTPHMLEELRMLSNVNNERDLLLQTVLVGQPQLLQLLNLPELSQFVQRIGVHCHLGTLTPAETAAYIRHRLGVVGGRPDIFDDLACAAVHYFTGGTPRLINLLCDHTMVYGFSADQHRIAFETVADVVADRNAGGLTPFRELRPGETPQTLLYELQPILNEINAPNTSVL